MLHHAAIQRLLVTSLCAASLFAMAPLLQGCIGGCGTYDPEGRHVDPDMGAAGGDTGSGGAGGSTGTSTSTDTGTGTGTVNPLGCACLDQFGAGSMDADALSKLATEGLSACFSGGAAAMEQSASCLPKVVGKDAKSGLEVQVYYFCSDVCPDQGFVGVGYKGIADQAACCDAGGAPVIDPAWGGFVACAPPGLGSGVTAGNAALCGK
jgi:hypothetical protein